MRVVEPSTKPAWWARVDTPTIEGGSVYENPTLIILCCVTSAILTIMYNASWLDRRQTKFIHEHWLASSIQGEAVMMEWQRKAKEMVNTTLLYAKHALCFE